MGRGGGADGFMQRFQFVCYPDQKKVYTLPNEAMPAPLENEIQRVMELLDAETSNQTRHLSFSPEAQIYFDEWLVKHENDSRSGNHPLYWESHLGKQAKAVAVLTIVLHRLSEVLTGELKDHVTLEILKAALEAQTYYLAHARRCYDSIVGGAVSDAEVILNLVRQKRLTKRFKAQDIYHQGLGGLSDSVRVRAALELLQDYGWLASEKDGGATGRRNEFWVVYPRMI
jgi:hypothetical protein